MSSRPPSLRQNVPLGPLTTIGIGGPAEWFLHARSVEELRNGLNWSRDQNLPLLLLGGGSNLVIDDHGFPGLVIHLDLRGRNAREEDDRSILLTAAAGEPWDPLVEWTVRQGWAGFECLSGIPGRVGATPIQNVGAYGQEVSETIVELEALDRTTGEIITLSNEQCRFRYRNSRFKSEETHRYIILSVRYRLVPGGDPTISYPDLRKRLSDRPSLEEVRETVIAVRRTKGMVVDPEDPDSRSSGSFFTNPILGRPEYESFLRRVSEQGIAPEGEVPAFETGDDQVKLSAAWLIERSGFHKGLVRGNVGLSSKHTLALINRGGATFAEVLALVEEIQDGVRGAFGIEIEPEPNLIAVDPS